MSVVDINANPDFNEYDAQDYKDLSTSLVGETFRETSLNMGLVFALLALLVLILLIFILKKIIFKP